MIAVFPESDNNRIPIRRIVVRAKAYLAIFLLLMASCMAFSQEKRKIQQRRKTTVDKVARLPSALVLKAGEKVMSFPSFAFRYFAAKSTIPSRPLPSMDPYWKIDGGVLIIHQSAPNLIPFQAPLMLPHGSQVQRIVVICKDNNKTGGWGVYLSLVSYKNLVEPVQGDAKQGYSFGIGGVRTSGASDKWLLLEDKDLENPTIDNQNNTYYLSLTLAPKCEFQQVKIFYKEPE